MDFQNRESATNLLYFWGINTGDDIQVSVAVDKSRAIGGNTTVYECGISAFCACGTNLQI